MKQVLLLLLVLAVSAQVFSQKKKTVVKQLKRDTIQKLPTKWINVSLGSAHLTGGTVSKKLFDSMARQGLNSGDPQVRIEGFYFNYTERNLYEDSLGNPIGVTDFTSEYCPGDTLTRLLRLTLAERTKRGDTAYFDGIRGIHAKGFPTKAYGLKFVIE